MATEIRRAHIHHKDRNPLNNNQNNWQVLCSKCHHQTFNRKKRNHTGIHIHIIFEPWLREEILKAAGYRCQQCGAPVGDTKHKRCNWCERVAAIATRVEWQDGRIMCRECFDDWTRQGRPAEFSPLIGQKLLLQKGNIKKRGNRLQMKLTTRRLQEVTELSF